MRGNKPKLVIVQDGSVKGHCPAAPAWLDAYAKREWSRVAPILFARGLLANDTSATVESYCISVGKLKRFEEQLQAEGHTVQTKDGPRINPAFRMQQAAMREARLLAVEMGITPHRRGKHEEPKVDEWAGMLG